MAPYTNSFTICGNFSAVLIGEKPQYIKGTKELTLYKLDWLDCTLDVTDRDSLITPPCHSSKRSDVNEHCIKLPSLPDIKITMPQGQFQCPLYDVTIQIHEQELLRDVKGERIELIRGVLWGDLEPTLATESGTRTGHNLDQRSCAIPDVAKKIGSLLLYLAPLSLLFTSMAVWFWLPICLAIFYAIIPVKTEPLWINRFQHAFHRGRPIWLILQILALIYLLFFSLLSYCEPPPIQIWLLAGFALAVWGSIRVSWTMMIPLILWCLFWSLATNRERCLEFTNSKIAKNIRLAAQQKEEKEKSSVDHHLGESQSHHTSKSTSVFSSDYPSIDELTCSIKIPLRGALLFDTGSFSIRSEGQGILSIIAQRAVDKLQSHPGLIVHVDGYADHRGDKKYNQKLSTLRAKAVGDWLKSQGLSAETVIIKGHGEEESDHLVVDPTLLKQQRRVVITIDCEGKP